MNDPLEKADLPAEGKLSRGRDRAMAVLRAMLTAPGHLWGVGTGAALLTFRPSGRVTSEVGGVLAIGPGACLQLRAPGVLLAWEGLSADPFSWTQGLALCVPDPGPAAAGVIVPAGGDGGAAVPGLQSRPAFDTGAGDGVVRLLFRPDPESLAGVGGLSGRRLAECLPAFASFSGWWMAETPLARLECRQEAGGAIPVVLTGAPPSRNLPLVPGLAAAVMVIPPHPLVMVPDDGVRFDRARFETFQCLLAEFGQPDLVALKRRAVERLVRGQPPGRPPGRLENAVIRVALRQHVAAGKPLPVGLPGAHDRALATALRKGNRRAG